MRGRSQLASTFLFAIALSLAGCASRTEIFGDRDIAGGGAGWLNPAVIVGIAGVIGALLGALIHFLWSNFVKWRARHVIYSAIYDRLDIALRATGASTITAAQNLYDTVQLYLGPVLELNSGAGKAIDRLKKALDGRIRDPASVAVMVTHTAPGGSAASTAATSSAAAGAGAASSAAAAAAAGAAGGSQYSVVTLPPAPPAPPERDASTREQMVEVRLALETFAAFWIEAAIKRKLRRAQQALLIWRRIQE